MVVSSSENITGGRHYILKDGVCFDGDLSGDYQEKNMNTVLVAARELHNMNLIRKEDSIRMGVSNVIGLTGLLGRWQCLSKQPYVVCDTGHNSGGWNYLAKQIARQAKNKRIVFGMVDDKDLDEDRKSTRLNSSHANISYAVFCLKKNKILYMILHIHRH